MYCIQHNHTHRNSAWAHAHCRQGGGKSLYLPPHQGWGRYVGKALWETPPQTGISEKPVWRNIAPDLFHPFDWAYFSTVRWAAEEFVFTHVCNHTFSLSQLRRRNTNFPSFCYLGHQNNLLLRNLDRKYQYEPRFQMLNHLKNEKDGWLCILYQNIQFSFSHFLPPKRK